MSKSIFALWFFLFFPLLMFASEGLKLGFSDFNSSDYVSLSPCIDVLADPEGVLEFDTVLSSTSATRFHPLQTSSIDNQIAYHWIRFSLQNESAVSQECKISMPFTDHIQFYYSDNIGEYHRQISGDLVPLELRPVKAAQLVFFSVMLPARSVKTYYARIESKNPMARQFLKWTFYSINLYPQAVFEAKYGKTYTIFQSLFFGAVIIMMMYNFFIFITLKDSTYFFYVCYTLILVIFIAANNGFLLEIVFPAHPKIDLYVRFLATPLVLFFYVLFSKFYLKPWKYAERWNFFVNALLIILPFSFLCMLSGYWALGRNISIITALCSFVILIVISIKSLYNGYTPAKYFLIANGLLIIGGLAFALNSFIASGQHQLAQYSLQLGIICEVTFFSFGLAARINLTQKELQDRILENERLEKETEIELKRIIEVKNIELEVKVTERTAEVLQQKEEIIAQNELLSLNFKQLEEAQQLINEQNLALSSANLELEKAVVQRTQELQVANKDLVKSNLELDRFIYRTSHDIKGPLARLLGLSHVALLDVQDTPALEYIKKLSFEANYLNYILSRLSTIYEINHMRVSLSEIDFKALIERVFDKMEFIEGFSRIEKSIQLMPMKTFCSDESLLTFIVQNLVENAVYFQNKRNTYQPFVKIHICQAEKSVLIKVIDNGAGIPPEEAATIFDMFSKAAGRYKTAGMGLYMASLSAQKLQGTVSLVKSEPGYTEFLVSLPYLN